ncbi:ATP-dependent DNA helicase 2 subunit 1 [Marchantia polymorpha subsp. ruderalis]|uniref:ATP-dependent DNA helicase 2 subunit KU70 n=2 Tax=Marchantia polymorpha TaxID=3197 RepID=A0A176VJU1_MARPO|nr:hypothetical protein AXG93_2584s1200 [Marchantia polymorpha subsp. ruderalis]PTQ31282.1 hypothetical protein MARPO_0113s0020 [Marchantia polymorpha]BBM97060.1 hypothetical protein Mp_1g02720 [Marchantia polymorpha subsp. ruderalis]|eukprot:PTQ31282.1 hypothetical protein MARPO_0113s0020 [Marchantia polymorpha]
MDWYTQQQQQSALFLDDEEDADARREELEFTSSKEYIVYMVDAGADMFLPLGKEENAKSFFATVIHGVINDLKTRIISRDTDEVGVCFFNTRGKKNIQESEGVYVFSELGQTSAQLIRELDRIIENFEKDIGSGVVNCMDAKESMLYNALWVAQGMLRTGSSKNIVKRLYIFTNNDDPMENASPLVKADLRRTTIQRAQDAQDLGIGIELYPFNRPGEQFNVNIFYSAMIQVDDNDELGYMTSASNRFSDLADQMRKKMFKKRVVRKMMLTILDGLDIGLRSYAMMRSATAGTTIWLDSKTNSPLKIERSYICSDTGALLTGPSKRYHEYAGKKVLFNAEEISELKKISSVQLQLLGFKPLEYLKDYYNLRPPTFLYPDEEAISGSTCAFIALHRSMLNMKKFALAFHGGTANPLLVALVPQEEETDETGGQLQPPGMQMIYLPYADDIRPAEKYLVDVLNHPQRGEEEQIDKAVALMRKLDLKDFTVYQIQNPALQKHYAILQALALEEDELPEVKDETLPDEEGMKLPSVVSAVKDFKNAAYGESYDEEMADEAALKAKGSAASQKRKASAENASREATQYDWNELADSGKLKDLTVVELKYYLSAHNQPLSGKKEILINRILTHLGK